MTPPFLFLSSAPDFPVFPAPPLSFSTSLLQREQSDAEKPESAGVQERGVGAWKSEPRWALTPWVFWPWVEPKLPWQPSQCPLWSGISSCIWADLRSAGIVSFLFVWLWMGAGKPSDDKAVERAACVITVAITLKSLEPRRLTSRLSEGILHPPAPP